MKREIFSGQKVVDFYVNSIYSSDGKSKISGICQKTIVWKIAEIGFTENMDLEPKDLGFGFFNYNVYTSDIEKARRFFVDKIIIRKGVEIDYQSSYVNSPSILFIDRLFYIPFPYY